MTRVKKCLPSELKEGEFFEMAMAKNHPMRCQWGHEYGNAEGWIYHTLMPEAGMNIYGPIVALDAIWLAQVQNGFVEVKP